MPANLSVPVPFLLAPTTSTVEDVIILCVSVLVAVTVSAESQAFMATFLGDRQIAPTERHHFNAFLHLNLLGTICFFLGGFGWSKEIPIASANFRHPRCYLFLCRLAGPLGNFIMANIAASAVWLLGTFGLEDKVFSGLLVVNMMTAVYGLLILPPLPGAVLYEAIIPVNGRLSRLYRTIRPIGPYLILGSLTLLRFYQIDMPNFAVNPAIKTACIFLRSLNLQ